MRRRSDRIELTTRWAGFFLILAATAVLSVVRGQEDGRAELEGEFTRTVRPFLETYCINCHGQQGPAAQMDLSGFTTMAALMQDGRRWSQMLERLEAEDMPPEGARHPTPRERRAAVDWFHAVREHETRRNAGDRGLDQIGGREFLALARVGAIHRDALVSTWLDGGAVLQCVIGCLDFTHLGLAESLR